MSHEEFKMQLEGELARVTTELETIAIHNNETDDWIAVPNPVEMNNADPIDNANATEEWNRRRAVMAQLEIRYRNIVRAIDKFETNTYGKCEISGDPIENERPEANPAARTNMANIDREKELPI